MNVLGFDIGGTKCAVALSHVSGEEIGWLKRWEMKTDSNWRAVLDLLIEQAKMMLEEFHIDRKTCRIGISCGGPLNADLTMICSPPNLTGWDQVPVVSYLSEALDMPARMQNDADACALAEWKYGAGRGSHHMIFLTFGTGLGAGLILNGRLYTGASHMAGEIGHVRMEPDGPVGYGKKGSLEGFCSGGGISQLAKKQSEIIEKTGEKAFGLEGDEEQMTAKTVAAAAKGGDENAKAILAQSGTYLGRGLSILIDLLNPEVIVIGSIYARAHEFFDEAMYDAIKQEALPKAVSACSIRPAVLGDQIGDYGAVMAALYV